MKNALRFFFALIATGLSFAGISQNNALDFDGNEDYVAANGVCDEITSTFTIENWFQFNTTANNKMIWAINESAKIENILVLGVLDISD